MSERCECSEHVCIPPVAQTARYPVQGGYEICAFCYAHGHMAPWRLARMAEHYAGLLP